MISKNCQMNQKGLTSQGCLDRVLIVDDSPHKSKLNYGNAIYPISFEGNQDDDELNILAKYLYSIKDGRNFRRIEKRNWRSKVNK